jgi:hypothetical protein
VTSYSGAASLNDAGLFESSLSGPFRLDDALVELTWRITKDARGSLLALTVVGTASDVPESTWSSAVYALITEVLAAALAEKRTSFFRRSLFFYIGAQLDGEYWLPGYRLAPAYPDDPEPYLINAERVITIDQEVNAIDAAHASVLANEMARRHSARISLLLNAGLYELEHSARWVIPTLRDASTPESVRCQLGFFHPSLWADKMPQKSACCRLGAYGGNLAARWRVAGELLSLPKEARRVLRGIDAATPLVTDAFDRGARLYQVGAVCGRLFPSVGLAYLVAAIEAISKAEVGCKGFSDFMRQHVISAKNIDDLLDYLYGVARSAHFHMGEFPLGEFSRGRSFDPLMDADSVQRDDLHFASHGLLREAIVNWLLRMIPAPGYEEPQDIASVSGREPT